MFRGLAIHEVLCVKESSQKEKICWVVRGFRVQAWKKDGNAVGQRWGSKAADIGFRV